MSSSTKGFITHETADAVPLEISVMFTSCSWMLSTSITLPDKKPPVLIINNVKMMALKWEK